MFIWLQLSQFFPICSPPPIPPDPLTQSLTIFHAHGSHIYVQWLLYSLYCTLYLHDYSVTTSLYFLIPSPFSPISPTPMPSGHCQNILCIYDSVSVLLVRLFWFLDSIVDRYIFIAILLFTFDLLLLLLLLPSFPALPPSWPFSISCNSGLVVMNFFSFFLSGKHFYLSFSSKW